MEKPEVGIAKHLGAIFNGLRRYVHKYYIGMRQRLGLAQAIMENPKILVLVEPFNGLDKDGVKEIREYLLSYK